MKDRDSTWNRRAVMTRLSAGLLLPAAAMLLGCGGDTGGSGELSREFEKPAEPPKDVTLPPDTGDDLHPRERRNQ